jgi:hypothetical protein
MKLVMQLVKANQCMNPLEKVLSNLRVNKSNCLRLGDILEVKKLLLIRQKMLLSPKSKDQAQLSIKTVSKTTQIKSSKKFSSMKEA